MWELLKDNDLVFSYLLPDFWLIVSICLLLIIICSNINYSQNLKFNQLVISYSIIFLIIELYFLINIFYFDLNDTYLNDQFVINSFIIFIKILIIVTSICVFISMYDNITKENYLSIEIPIIIFISIEGMSILMSSNDLLIMYLALELQSLSLYILCSINRYSNLSIEAGLKYFILGSFSSAILLYGISLIYGFLGTTNYYDINIILYSDYINTNIYILYFSLSCILIGFLFKLAIFPFHFWISDIFEGSPNIITYFFAVVPKISILGTVFKIFFVIFIKFINFYIYIIIICSMLSILVGSILALYQIKIKRLFAYSAVVHMGYILLSMSIGSWLGIYISFYYLIIYILVSINIFTIYLSIYKNDNTSIKNIVDIISILHSNFYLSLMLVISLLSLAGIPPLAGFYGKLYLFFLLIQTGNYFIALYVMLFSVLSSVYYIRFIRFIWFTDKVNEININYIQQITEVQAYTIVILVIINISFIFLQGPIMIFLDNIFINIICLY